MNRTHYLLAATALVFLVCVGFLLRLGKVERQVAVTKPRPTAPKAATGRSARSLGDIEGLTLVRLACDSQRCQLPLRGTFQRRGCDPGELDRLLALRRHLPPATPTLLSVERLPLGDASALDTKSLSDGDLRAGFRESLSLPPAVREPAQYGLFLCTDAAGRKRCGGKRFDTAAAATAIQRSPPARGAAVPATPTDAAFLFQYLLVVGDRAAVVTAEPKAVPGVFQELAAFLTEALPASREEANRGVHGALSLWRSGGSPSLAVATDTVELTLNGRGDDCDPTHSPAAGLPAALREKATVVDGANGAFVVLEPGTPAPSGVTVQRVQDLPKAVADSLRARGALK